MMNKEYHKNYYEKNRQRAIRKAEQWQKDNPDKVKEINKKYREEHREEITRKRRLKKSEEQEDLFDTNFILNLMERINENKS